MIEPFLFFFIKATACLHPRKTPSEFIAMVLCHCSMVVVSMLAAMAIPALLTNTSRWPWRFSTAAATASQSATLETSWRMKSAVPPASRIICTVSSPCSGLMSVQNSVAPSLANKSEVARPKPMPEPVTSAIFPDTRPISIFPLAKVASANHYRSLPSLVQSHAQWDNPVHSFQLHAGCHMRGK